MPAPIYARPVQGTSPNQFVENSRDETAINAALKALYDAILANATEEQIQSVLDAATAAGLSASQAAASAGATLGINVNNAAVRASSFTIVEADMWQLNICTPSTGATLDVTLPPASSFVGKTIAFTVPAGTSGRVRFLTTIGQSSSVVSDFQSDAFWIWQRETVTLLATSARWEILDWQKNPLHLRATGPVADIPLSTTGVAVEVNEWVAPAWDATYLRNYIWALDGAAPQRVIVPRRGKFHISADIFVSWSGTPPSSLYALIPNAKGSNVENRSYATFIQPTSPTQAIINYQAVAQNNAGIELRLFVYCTGGTSPIINSTVSRAVIELTEIV